MGDGNEVKHIQLGEPVGPKQTLELIHSFLTKKNEDFGQDMTII